MSEYDPQHEDEKDWVYFGVVAEDQLGQQTQYASRYIDGKIEGYPKLGEGLRFKNVDGGSYHDIKIHKDDIEEFVRRAKEYKKSRGIE